METLSRMLSTVSEFYKDINPATLSGAIDVVVVERADGSLHCSPFHVRFGKMSLLRPQEKLVDVEVNGRHVDFPMKVSESGEAFFVVETDKPVPDEFRTSPIPSQEEAIMMDIMDTLDLNVPKSHTDLLDPVGDAAMSTEALTALTLGESPPRQRRSRAATSEAALMLSRDDGDSFPPTTETPVITENRKSLPRVDTSTMAAADVRDATTTTPDARVDDMDTPTATTLGAVVGPLADPRKSIRMGSSDDDIPDVVGNADALRVTSPVTITSDVQTTLDEDRRAASILTPPLSQDLLVVSPTKEVALDDVTVVTPTQEQSPPATGRPTIDTSSEALAVPSQLPVIMQQPLKSDQPHIAATASGPDFMVTPASPDYVMTPATAGDTPRTPPAHLRGVSSSAEYNTDLSPATPLHYPASDTEFEIKGRHSRNVSTGVQREMNGNDTTLSPIADHRQLLSDTEMDYTTPIPVSQLTRSLAQASPAPLQSSRLPTGDNKEKSTAVPLPSSTTNGVELPRTGNASPKKEEPPAAVVNTTVPDFSQLGEYPFELALCKGVATIANLEESFRTGAIDFETFSKTPGLLNDPSLVIRLGQTYYTWHVLAPLMGSLFFFQKPLPNEQLPKFFEHAVQTWRAASGKDQKHPDSAKSTRSYLGGWSWWGSSAAAATTSAPTSVNAVASSPSKIPASAPTKSPTNMTTTASSPIAIPGTRSPASRTYTVARDIASASAPTRTSPSKSAREISTFSEDEDGMGGQYRKTLRLSSDQLRSLNLKPGPNTISFSVNTRLQGKATCAARLFLYKHDVQIVISDIDGTITKSDALGHLFNMVGKDWTHPGIASLYTNIQRNGYEILYLTSRAIGQADTTRGYLRGIEQGASKLPVGPVIMSPDRLIVALKREVIDRRPEEFKIACLRDIKKLFGDRSPFYAGFGNRITDALSYRAVGIPTFRIYSISPNGEIKMDFFIGYKSSYTKLNDLVDHIFPPIIRRTQALIGAAAETGDAGRASPAPPTPAVPANTNLDADNADNEFNDFAFWRAPLPVIEMPVAQTSPVRRPATMVILPSALSPGRVGASSTSPRPDFSASESQRMRKRRVPRAGVDPRRTRSAMFAARGSAAAAFSDPNASAASQSIRDALADMHHPVDQFDDPGQLGDEELEGEFDDVEEEEEEDEDGEDGEETETGDDEDDDEDHVAYTAETLATYPFI